MGHPHDGAMSGRGDRGVHPCALSLFTLDPTGNSWAGPLLWLRTNTAVERTTETRARGVLAFEHGDKNECLFSGGELAIDIFTCGHGSQK